MKKTAVVHYGILGALLIAAIAAFLLVKGNGTLQLGIGIITAVSYVLWGIIHHKLSRDLHLKVVIEYVLIGCIAVILLATILR